MLHPKPDTLSGLSASREQTLVHRSRSGLPASLQRHSLGSRQHVGQGHRGYRRATARQLLHGADEWGNDLKMGVRSTRKEEVGGDIKFTLTFGAGTHRNL